MYHGIAEVSGDRSRCVVPPLGVEILRAQLIHLRRRYQVVSLHELRDRVIGRAADQPFPVALSFDDDLESHHRFVAPLLSELELRATFFLTGRSLDGPSAFYWHDLEELFARGGEYWQEVLREVSSRWGSAGGDVGLHMVSRTMAMMQPDERDVLAERLKEILGSPPRDRGLPEANVRELVAAGFEIGFHTKGHYQLQILDDNRLSREIREGSERLTKIAGRPLRTIAYPYGPGDLRIAATAADAGFEVGVVWTNIAATASSHPLLLDRVDGAWPSAAEFAFRMARYVSASD
jgi:peptidoglycan/xylan/chitin deacetylase (PgdA/CDA1 family)